MEELTVQHLTHDLPGIGGEIKRQTFDFQVEELPLYSPSGEGQHTFFEIRKEGISTFQAVRTIANALAVPPNRIRLVQDRRNAALLGEGGKGDACAIEVITT